MEVIRGIYAALASGDVPAVLEALSPDVEWNEAESFPYADGNPYIGRDAVLEGVFARLGSDWDRFNLVVEQMIDADDSVVALGRYKGRHSRTGGELDAEFAHVWWLEDGKVIRFQQYTDTQQANAVVGRQAGVPGNTIG
ncbi:MAG: nuclear transport factor 2 family protein [Gemmatimonadota bacterium]|nr:nuclear transport factor 2 family protein [Gemmatimonadota bacterium]